MLTVSEKIEDQIRHPEAYQIKEIKVLKAWDQIPYNKQIGPTCGIYALDAAMQIRGINIAPRKREAADRFIEPGQVSWRYAAKDQRLSQVGEIGGAQDLARLAASFGFAVDVKRFDSEQALWSVIQKAVADDYALVLPYSCLGDDGAPAWSRTSTGFAHWCLLFGYVEFSYREAVRHVFMTTYGKYHEVSPYQLFKSNQRIQDWGRQTWVKVYLWSKKPGPESTWYLWDASWRSKSTLLEDLKMSARTTGVGRGFGIGTKEQLLHKFVDPPKPMNLNISEQVLAQAVKKTVDLEAVKYTETMCGQCVVVTAEGI